MVDYLADVRQSMLSCRRNEATPQDFLQALHTHQLSLRSLARHLDPPVSSEKSNIPIERYPIDEEEKALLKPQIPLLRGPATAGYIPGHFPVLPDIHTYRVTPSFVTRETDPMAIREQATKEGRLGEEALRKLVTAEAAGNTKVYDKARKNLSLREQRDQLWMQTMQSVAEEQEQEQDAGDQMYVDRGARSEAGSAQALKGHISSGVNADKQYWRKPVRRKEA